MTNPSKKDLKSVKSFDGDSFVESYGTSDEDLIAVLGSQVANALGGREALDPITHGAILKMLSSMAPQNAHEGLLAIQLVSTHFLAMDCISKSRDRGSIEILEAFSRMTERLMKLFLKQTEALRKLKNGGEQRIIIEKVEVQSGGQAVVGSVERGGS